MNKILLNTPCAPQKIIVCETTKGFSILKHQGNTYGSAPFQTNNKYKLNGVEFTVPEAKAQYQFAGKVNSLQQEVVKTYLVGYKHIETGEIISNEDFRAQYNELISKRVPDPEDEDCLMWATLTDKQTHDIFVKSYEQIKETETEWVDFPLEFFKIAHSDHQEIIPLWQIGEPVDNGMCQYTPAPQKWFKEIADELGFEQLGGDVNYSATKGFKYCMGKHNDLQFVTMNGTYLYGSNSNEWKFYNLTDTYDKCVERLLSDKAKIRAKITQQKRVLEESSLNKNEREEILKELGVIQSYLWEISAKEKSRSALDTVRGKVKKMIENL